MTASPVQCEAHQPQQSLTDGLGIRRQLVPDRRLGLFTARQGTVQTIALALQVTEAPLQTFQPIHQLVHRRLQPPPGRQHALSKLPMLFHAQARNTQDRLLDILRQSLALRGIANRGTGQRLETAHPGGLLEQTGLIVFISLAQGAQGVGRLLAKLRHLRQIMSYQVAIATLQSFHRPVDSVRFQTCQIAAMPARHGIPQMHEVSPQGTAHAHQPARDREQHRAHRFSRPVQQHDGDDDRQSHNQDRDSHATPSSILPGTRTRRAHPRTVCDRLP